MLLPADVERCNAQDEDECKVQSVDGSKAQAGDEFRAQEGQSRESRNSFETPEVAKKTEEALEIVDQLLAGAKPTDDQLVAIKAAVRLPSYYKLLHLSCFTHSIIG